MPDTLLKRTNGTIVSPWPPSTIAVTLSIETFNSWATKVRNRAVSRMPAIPMTRFFAKPETFSAVELGRPGTIGVATPGAISTRTGLMKNANSTVLNGRPLARDLSERLARSVRLANDANCFALSEAADGAGAGAEVVFGVILGTGVGGGLVIGGRPLGGRNRIAGEWGHNPLPWPNDLADKKAGQVNAFFRWQNVKDEPDNLETKLFLVKPAELKTTFTIPAEATADVSLRRLQKLRVAPGTRVRWTFGATNGEAQADATGCITIPRLKITAEPTRLSVARAK